MADEMAPVEALDHDRKCNRKWTDEDTRTLIPWRCVNKSLFTGKRNASVTGFEVFIKESGLGSLDPKLVKKRWENLVHKYKELKKPRTGVSREGGGVTAASWKWYALMDEALGARPSVTPPVLFVSSSWEVAESPPPAVVRNASGASSTVPKRRRADAVEVAELIQENDRRFSEAWTGMKKEKRAREAAEREERRHREALEREESRHREMVAMEERRFNFLRESEERRDRETAAERRDTAAREERRERETAAREERLLTLLEKISAQK